MDNKQELETALSLLNEIWVRGENVERMAIAKSAIKRVRDFLTTEVQNAAGTSREEN